MAIRIVLLSLFWFLSPCRLPAAARAAASGNGHGPILKAAAALGDAGDALEPAAAAAEEARASSDPLESFNAQQQSAFLGALNNLSGKSASSPLWAIGRHVPLSVTFDSAEWKACLKDGYDLWGKKPVDDLPEEAYAVADVKADTIKKFFAIREPAESSDSAKTSKVTTDLINEAVESTKPALAKLATWHLNEREGFQRPEKAINFTKRLIAFFGPEKTISDDIYCTFAQEILFNLIDHQLQAELAHHREYSRPSRGKCASDEDLVAAAFHYNTYLQPYEEACYRYTKNCLRISITAAFEKR